MTFLGGTNEKKFSYREAKSTLESAIGLCSTKREDELERLARGPGLGLDMAAASIALAFLSILRDCQGHCQEEGAEVKRLGGLHVIGTALHESRRVDNQVLAGLLI